MGALNIPSASDIERLTRRLRSVSQRLEGIEDGLDRIEHSSRARPTADGDIAARLEAIEERLAPSAPRSTTSATPPPLPRAQERLHVDTRTPTRRPSPRGSAARRRRRSPVRRRARASRGPPVARLSRAALDLSGLPGRATLVVLRSRRRLVSPAGVARPDRAPPACRGRLSGRPPARAGPAPRPALSSAGWQSVVELRAATNPLAQSTGKGPSPAARLGRGLGRRSSSWPGEASPGGVVGVRCAGHACAARRGEPRTGRDPPARSGERRQGELCSAEGRGLDRFVRVRSDR